MKLVRTELIVGLILLLSLFLRIYDLDGESIWLDEGYSVGFAHVNPFQIIKIHAVSAPGPPPLYFIILHYWVTLFGDSEFSIRFPSALFGALATLLIYKVGNLIFGQDVGMLSAFLLALSSFHIRYSQEARMYSLMALLTLLSMYFFLKILEKRKLIDSIGYILSSILLMYTHPYGLFIILAQNLYVVPLFLFSKKSYTLTLKRWILLQFILFALFIPWSMILTEQISKKQGGGFWLPVRSIISIIGSFYRYSGSALLFPLFLLLLVCSIVTCEKIRGRIAWKNLLNSFEGYRWHISLSNLNKVYFLLVWLSAPIIVPFIISRFSKPIYLTRYTIAASLAFYLLVAKGIANIQHKYFKLVIISLVIVCSLADIRGYYAKVNKEQWREVANYIDANAESGSVLLFHADFGRIPFNYYSKRTDLIKRRFPGKTRNIDENTIKESGSTGEDYNEIWVILSHIYGYEGLITSVLKDTDDIASPLASSGQIDKSGEDSLDLPIQSELRGEIISLLFLGESYSVSYYKKYVGIEVYRFRMRTNTTTN